MEGAPKFPLRFFLVIAEYGFIHNEPEVGKWLLLHKTKKNDCRMMLRIKMTENGNASED